MTKDSGYYSINEHGEFRHHTSEEAAHTSFLDAMKRLGRHLGDDTFQDKAELLGWGILSPRGEATFTRIEHVEGDKERGVFCPVCADNPYQEFRPVMSEIPLPVEDKARDLVGAILAQAQAAKLGAELSLETAAFRDEQVGSRAVIHVLSALLEDWKKAYEDLGKDLESESTK